MTTEVTVALDKLNQLVAAYIPLARKAPAEALAKQGSKLTFELANRLTALTPAKGAITTQAISALHSGRGVKVRESVKLSVAGKMGARSRLSDRRVVFGKRGVTTTIRKGKRLNLQALMVKAELGLRERGRGYLPHVARIKGLDQLGAAAEGAVSATSKGIIHRGRYAQRIADAGMMVNVDETSLTITFGFSGSEAGDALSTPRSQAETAAAVDAVADDVAVYLARKFQEGVAFSA